jgi:uncharacterized protein
MTSSQPAAGRRAVGRKRLFGFTRISLTPLKPRTNLTMKLQPDRLDVQSILGYGPGWVGLANQGVAEKVSSSVLIGSRGERQEWLCEHFEDLSAAHFEQIVGLRPELVIFGSGTRLRFVPPAFLKDLMSLRIGVETMDTLAACRTYNILAGEGRHVIAALVIERSAGTAV